MSAYFGLLSMLYVVFKVGYNGRVLGEEALTESLIELQILKISTNVK